MNQQLVAGQKLPQRYFLDISKYRSVLLIRNRGSDIHVSELQFDAERHSLIQLKSHLHNWLKSHTM